MGSHSETAGTWFNRDQSANWCRDSPRSPAITATVTRTKISALSAETGATIVNKDIAV